MATRRVRENRLLAALQRADRARLAPHLQPFDLEAGRTLYEPGDVIDQVYFPHKGQITLLVAAENGEEVGSAVIGPEGVVGLGGLTSGDCSFSLQRVQLAGSASRVARAPFLEMLDDSKRLRQIVAGHHDAFTARLLQSVFCQAMHPAGPRVARWLLDAFDAVGDDNLQLTQEALARALGLRRATVTLALNRLAGASVLGGERGRIELLDRAGLEAQACVCYKVVRDNFDRVLAMHR